MEQNVPTSLDSMVAIGYMIAVLRLGHESWLEARARKKREALELRLRASRREVALAIRKAKRRSRMNDPMTVLREGFAVKPGPNQYLCDCCREIFDKGRTDEEARAEAEQRFGAALHPAGDPPALVCDDCYNEIMGWAKDKGLPT